MATNPPQPFDSTDYDSPTLGNVSQTLPGQFDFSNIIIEPTSVVGATVGYAYTQQITISGGYAPYGNLIITTGNLATNLTLSITTQDYGNDVALANITGIPNTPQTANFTISGNDVIANTLYTSTQEYSLQVARPNITVSPSSLSNGSVGTFYTQTFTSANGVGTLTYSNVGSLPANLVLNSATGNLSGTPTANASTNFTIRVTDAYSSTGNTAYTLIVNSPTITVAPSSLSNTTVGNSYTATFSASGGVGTYTYSNIGNLPASLSLASATGNLTGTITANTTPVNFTIRATDSYGTTGNTAYTVNIAQPTVTVTPSTVANGVVGTPYSAAVSATGGTTPYRFLVTSGNLPTNLSLSSLTGNITGTPTTNATSTFTVTAYDTYGSPGNRSYTVGVTRPTITVSPSSLSNAVVGNTYTQLFTANGSYDTSYVYSNIGNLPPSLTLTSANGIGNLTGTITSNTTPANFTIVATDTYSTTGNTAYTLNIAQPTITVTPSTLSNGVAGTSYTATISASGGAVPYRFSVTGGTLPVGLSLSSTGNITGAPSYSGTSNFTITAYDLYNSRGNQSYTVGVTSPAINTTFQPFDSTDFDSPELGNISQTAFGQFDYSNITIQPTSIANGTVGFSYTQGISIVGGIAPYGNLTVSTGNLPAGLSLGNTTQNVLANTASANITGIPTTPGDTTFIISGTDEITGTTFTSQQSYTVGMTRPTITVGPTSVVGGVVGVPYTETFVANGGGGTYTYTLAVGDSLPVGLSLSSTGSLTGTITSNVTPVVFTVDATDSYGTIGNNTYSLPVTQPTITVTPATIANAVVGVPYTTTITATGGTTPYVWATTNPAILAAGLSVTGASSVNSTTGTVQLAGTPAADGTFTFALSATDLYYSQGVGNTYTMGITRPAITLSPSTLPGATTGAAYANLITASGGTGPYTFSVTGSTLPADLVLASNGYLTGIVLNDAGQPFDFEVTATDSYNSTGNIDYSLAVTDPTIVISPSTANGGVVGVPYTQTFTSAGGTGPYTYSLTGGTLPANVTLSTSGSLTGTPTAAGNSNFTITSTDSFASTGSFSYANVAITLPTIIIDPDVLPNTIVRTAYDVTLRGFGGTEPYTFAVTDGALPPGLTLNSVTGNLTGNTTTTSTYNFEVTATDSYDSIGSQPYRIVVEPPPITLSPATIPNGISNVAYTPVTFTSSGGFAPYTYTSTQMPEGMSLASSTGVFSGTPRVIGYQPFTVTTTDIYGYFESQVYNFVVIPDIPPEAIEVYVGGIRQTSGYTVTSKYPATIEFDTAPPAGVDVTILVRQGVSWYQPTPYEASDGVPLQETDTPAARFLRGVN